jgi:integrase/recombinase XerD
MELIMWNPQELDDLITNDPRLSQRSKVLYRRHLQEYLAWSHSHPGQWTVAGFSSFYKELNKRMTPQSASNIMAGLRFVSRRLAERRQDPSQDFAGYVRLAKNAAPQRKPALTIDEAHALRRACYGDSPTDLRDRAMVELFLNTGMRRFSAAGIHLDHLGHDKKYDFPLVEIRLKGGSSHRVPLAPRVLEGLAPWREWLKAHGVKSGALFRRLSDGIGVKKQQRRFQVGEGLSVEGVWFAIKRRAELAGLSDVSPHSLRRSFITWLKERGTPDTLITCVTGHLMPGRSRMLDEVYTDSGALSGEAIRAVEGLWR